MKTQAYVLTLMLLTGCGDASLQSTTTAVSADGATADPEDNVIGDKETGMSWDHSEFGTTADDRKIEQYTLKNTAGTVVRLINYGATLVALETVDRDGKLGNIVLGHSSVKHWLDNPCYFGCTVGRYANRIGQGVFGLEGNIYTLARNDGDNHLHGGKGGFHSKLWEAEATSDETSVTVTFRRTSPDGEDNYPGNLHATVQYTLNEDNELRIHYEATTDKATVVNLTNHSYWNLTGDAATNDILEHELTLRCDRYLPVNESLIPTGDMLAVAETPMNFTTGKPVGQDIADTQGGYDHCFVVNREMEGLVPAARVFEPESGRVLEISTTEPGIQFYTGNFLNGEEQNGGFAKQHGLCLETQHYPDTPNQPHFPSTTLQPGDLYESTTVHKFSVYKG